MLYEQGEAGRRWQLYAASSMGGGHVVWFDDAAHVRAFVQAVLDMLTAAEPYERVLEFADPADDTWFAELTVGRDPFDGLTPYLHFQVCVHFPGPRPWTDVGLEVCCPEVDVDRLHAEARALSAALDAGA